MNCRAGCSSRAYHPRDRPTRQGWRRETSFSRSARTACARRPSSTTRCGSSAVPARKSRCASCMTSTWSTSRCARSIAWSISRREPCISASGGSPKRPMLVYAATIFASAFLLFLVQPIVAKEILPWFGGSAAVWTTCLVFFQTALLAGYAYSDMAVRRLQPRAQVALHVVLLATSLALLPIIPAAHWKPAGDENPSWLILGLLAITIGLPFFLLSTTSPLVQAWFARTRAGQSPYRLFALSNLASMMALLGYPLLLEPNSTTRGQAIGWSAAYAAFVVLCA